MIDLIGKREKNEVINKGYQVTEDINKALFPIEAKTIYFNNDEGIREELKHKAIVNADTSDVLYVGRNYEIMTNNEIINLLEKAGIFQEFELNDVRINNSKTFEFNYMHKDKELKFGDETAVPKLTVRNSYDASMALQLHLGLYIKICSNGMMGNKNFSFKARHTTNKVNEFRDMLSNAQNKLITEVPDYFSGKDFHDDNEMLMAQFNQLTKGIPDLKTKLNPVKEQLNIKTNDYIKERNYKKEFALLMASTDLTTHGYKDISNSYLNILDNNIPTVFFDN